MKDLNFPKVGLRTIKTAISVFLCLVLLPDEPFFACLTSVFCLQDTVENSIKMGKNRGIGTVFGASIGLIIMMIFKKLTNNIESVFISKTIIYLFVAFGIIVVIYTTHAIIKLPGAITIACIAFLGVTTAHAYAAPIHYALNRTFETLCGIVIAIIVNKTINPPHK